MNTIEQSVLKKIADRGSAALADLSKEELEWYQVNIAPKHSAALRASRDSGALAAANGRSKGEKR